MKSEFTEWPYMEILTEGDGKPGISFFDGEIMILGETALALNFTDSFLDTLKANQDKFKAVIVCPVLPPEVIENFKENLTDLIKYIIFDDQTCVHKFFVICEDGGLFADATAAVTENKTLISSTQTMFPEENNSLFNCRLDDFSGSIMIDSNRYYWFEIDYELIPDHVTKPTPAGLESEVLALPLCPDAGEEAMEMMGEWGNFVTETYDTHQFTFHVRKIFTKTCAGLSSSIDEDKFDIVVKFYIMTGRYKYKPGEKKGDA